MVFDYVWAFEASIVLLLPLVSVFSAIAYFMNREDNTTQPKTRSNMIRRRRNRCKGTPYDPKNPPVINNISPMISMCLTAQGFNDRVIEEIKSFVACHWMADASYEYDDRDCKSFGSGYSTRQVVKEKSFSARFGPNSSYSIFSNTQRGSIEIKLETPLAQELLDIQRNGMNIVFKGKRQGGKWRYSRNDPDVDTKNYSHLFRLYKHRSCETSSKDEDNTWLTCFIVRQYVVLCEEDTTSYAGKHIGDYSETLQLNIYACPLTDALIQAFNNGLAKWMEAIAGPPISLPYGLLSGLKDYIGEEHWQFKRIFQVVKKYSDSDDDSWYDDSSFH